MPDTADLTIKTLGNCRIESPLAPLLASRAQSVHYVDEYDRVLLDDTVSMLQERAGMSLDNLPGFEPAGARRKIYFDPSKTRAGIVTCGGLCPGLNDVIRGLALELMNRYGVRKVYGFCNGFQGFVPCYSRPVLELTPSTVADINEHGGTILGSSRGQQDPVEIVDCLERMGINMLFVIGGDGTIRGAMAIAREIAERGIKISVIGVPKTIDNDISYIDQSFGFQTAFAEGAKALRAAHVEALGAPNGIGLVKLMGRHSGFIACYSALAMSDCNIVLIPEVPFTMEGENGLLAVIKRRIETRGHAVIAAAEGAGQELFDASSATDASGNKRLHDIGVLLKARICDHFAKLNMELNLKYIDPSYQIRSVPANAFDSVYAMRLAHYAVHAAMAGRTEMVVSRYRSRFVHVPMATAICQRQNVDPHGDLWITVLENTGQPREMR